MGSNQLFFLGTSDGVSSPNRAHASILLTLDDTVLLLDCGEPCSHTLVKHGTPADLIDAILISHMHSDHVGGFPMVIQWFWLAGRARKLPVYMPKEGIDPFKRLLRATYLFDELLKFGLQMHPLHQGQEIRIGKARVEARLNHHLAGLKNSFYSRYRNRFESFSYRVTRGGVSVVYSGDLAAPGDLAPLLKQRTTVLVVELAHFEPETLFRTAAEFEIDRIVITHLGGHVQSALPRTKKIAEKYFPKKKVVFAQDGMTVEF